MAKSGIGWRNIVREILELTAVSTHAIAFFALSSLGLPVISDAAVIDSSMGDQTHLVQMNSESVHFISPNFFDSVSPGPCRSTA